MKPALRRAGVLYQPHIPAARELAMILDARLRTLDVEPWLASAWEVGAGEMVDTDLVITLGGDGTVLRAARATAAADHAAPPLLSVDFGRLGFLTEVAPEEAEAALARVLAGDCWIEERYLLLAEQFRAGQCIGELFAVNEVVLARSDGPHALRLGLRLDGVHVANYVADGVIVATPTGSTAYAYAAGGPIVAPTLDAMLVIPAAAHLSLIRSLVVPSSTVVELTADSHRPSVVTADGQQVLNWEDGDRLRVTRSDRAARFVRLGRPGYFFATLHARLSKPRPF